MSARGSRRKRNLGPADLYALKQKMQTERDEALVISTSARVRAEQLDGLLERIDARLDRDIPRVSRRQEIAAHRSPVLGR